MHIYTFKLFKLLLIGRFPVTQRLKNMTLSQLYRSAGQLRSNNNLLLPNFLHLKPYNLVLKSHYVSLPIIEY